jgi:hypothetical protein
MTAEQGSQFPIPPPPGARGTLRLLKAGTGFCKPDVWVVDAEGNASIWKTYGRRPGWERRTLGKWLAQREGRIIGKLEDMEGFPKLLGHPDPWTVEMTLLEAEPVPEVKAGGALNEAYFTQLWVMISAMHARGIIHGDLRRKNLLRAPGDPGTPRIVDFTQCPHFREPIRGIRGWIYREAVHVDRVTFVKLKKWFLGRDNIAREELAELDDIPWHLKLGRGFRNRVYRPFKHWRTGKKRGNKG